MRISIWDSQTGNNLPGIDHSCHRSECSMAGCSQTGLLHIVTYQRVSFVLVVLSRIGCLWITSVHMLVLESIAYKLA